MADVLVDNVDYGEQGEVQEKKSLWTKINDFRRESPYLFWGIVVAATVLLVVVIVAVIVIIKKRKNKSVEGGNETVSDEGGTTETFKEPYMGTNTLNDEFDYLSSLLDSTLGDNAAFNNIVSKAKTV